MVGGIRSRMPPGTMPRKEINVANACRRHLSAIRSAIRVRWQRMAAVGAENLCHVGGFPPERGRFSQAPGVRRAGPGSGGGGMIFRLWA